MPQRGNRMRVEQAAYANRWRGVSPGAKGGFALAGLIAAFVAASPGAAVGVALCLLFLTVVGARVPLGLYLRVAAPAVGFLALSCLTLLVSLAPEGAGTLAWRWAPEALPRVAALAGRAVAGLAALLLLVLTTPLPDLILLLRQLRVPEVLLDLMVVGYRMLFVFAEALHDTVTAQAARLGYGGWRRSLRSLGLLSANLAVQVWSRARALQAAADARSAAGGLRFLAPEFRHARRDTALAALAGAVLIVFAARGGA